MIRKALYGGADMSNTDDSLGIEHLDHCVDMLHQSIMVSYHHAGYGKFETDDGCSLVHKRRNSYYICSYIA